MQVTKWLKPRWRRLMLSVCASTAPAAAAKSCCRFEQASPELREIELRGYEGATPSPVKCARGRPDSRRLKVSGWRSRQRMVDGGDEIGARDRRALTVGDRDQREIE